MRREDKTTDHIEDVPDIRQDNTPLRYEVPLKNSVFTTRVGQAQGHDRRAGEDFFQEPVDVGQVRAVREGREAFRFERVRCVVLGLSLREEGVNFGLGACLDRRVERELEEDKLASLCKL